MLLTQGQTAIFESDDDVPAILIAAESMRGKAHSELHMGSAQARPVLDCALDHGRRRGGSFPSHLPSPENADALLHTPQTTIKGSRALLVGAEWTERISDHTLQSATRRGHGL